MRGEPHARNAIRIGPAVATPTIDLLTGGTGQTSNTPDPRITDVNELAGGPFQLHQRQHVSPTTPTRRAPCTASTRCGSSWTAASQHSTAANPSGCNGKLFSWVEVTVGAGTNGAPQAKNFSTEYSPTATTTGEGSTALGFYNVQQGDVPYFKSLADKYAMSDNFHQSVERRHGREPHHARPRRCDLVQRRRRHTRQAAGERDGVRAYNGAANPDKGVVHEIENPNPAPGTNNWYTEDGYGDSYNAGYPPPYTAAPVSGGGSYSDCSDPNAARREGDPRTTSPRSRGRSIRAASRATTIC